MTPHLFSLERRAISTLQIRPHGSHTKKKGSLNNDDGDGDCNENGKKAKGLH